MINVNGRLYAFNLNTLDPGNVQTKWTLELGESVKSSPALDGNNNIYITTDAGKLIKVNDAGTSGTIVWQYDSQGECVSSPVLDVSANAYFAGKEGKVFAVNTTNGSLLWESETHYSHSNPNEILQVSPSISDDGSKIYVGDSFGKLYAMETSTGNIIWAAEIGSDIIEGPILAVEGNIYFCASGNAVSVIDPNKGNRSLLKDQTNPVWSTFQGNPQRTGYTGEQSEDPTLVLNYPNGGETLTPGSNIDIQWSSYLVENISIEFSSNNGTSWTEITNGVSASTGIYSWTIPNDETEEGLIKISQLEGNQLTDESDAVFSIETVQEQLGGPYGIDEYTVLLMHFENNLNNESSLSSNGIVHGSGISYEANSVPSLNQCLRINNTSSGSQTNITIPTNNNLQLQGSWTVELWFYIETWGDSHNSFPGLLTKTTLSWKSNYYMELKSQENYLSAGFYLGDDQYAVATDNSIFSPGGWYHAALVRDAENNKMELFIHDSERKLVQHRTSSVSSSIDPDIANTDLKIGCTGYPEGYFDGYFDEIRISNVARDFVTVDLENEPVVIPNEYSLKQNFPNPFNPSTTISYGIPNSGHVIIKIYDILGNEIAMPVSGYKSAGMHFVSFDASNLGSGVYFYSIKINQFFDVKKMLLVK